MKGRIARVALLLAAAVALAGCSNALTGAGDPDDGLERSAVTISLGLVGGSSILPDPLVNDIAEYRVSLSSIEHAPIEQTVPAPASTITVPDIPSGFWELVVEGLDGTSTVIATSGTQPVSIFDLQVPVTVTLAPLASGQGVLDLAFTWPIGAVISIDGDAEPFGGATATPLAGGPYTGGDTGGTISATLDAGAYLVTLNLYDGGGLPVRQFVEIAHVHANRTTNGSYAFAATDLNGPPAPPTGLSADTSVFGQVALSWVDESPFNTGYLLEREIQYTDNWIVVPGFDQNDPSATTFVDTTVQEGTVYRYRLTALGTAYGNSAPTTRGVVVPRSEPDVRYVATPVDGGSDTTGAGTRGEPYATIGRAIASFATGESGTVRVASGTYDEHVSISNRAIVIEGGYSSVDWSRDVAGNPASIITSSDPASDYVVEFRFIDLPDPVGLDGVTVEAQPIGALNERGAVNVENARPTLSQVTIRGANSTNASSPRSIGILVEESALPSGVTIQNGSDVVGSTTAGTSMAEALLVLNGVSGAITVTDSVLDAGQGGLTSSALNQTLNLLADTDYHIENTTIRTGTNAGDIYAIRSSPVSLVVRSSVIELGTAGDGGIVRGIELLSGGALEVTDSTIVGGAATGMGNLTAIFVQDTTTSLSITGNSIVLGPTRVVVGIDLQGQNGAADVVANTIQTSGSPLNEFVTMALLNGDEFVANNLLVNHPGAASGVRFAGISTSGSLGPRVYNNTIVSTHPDSEYYGVEIKGSAFSTPRPDLRNNLFVNMFSTNPSTFGVIETETSTPPGVVAPSFLVSNAFVGLTTAFRREDEATDPNTEADLNDESQTTEGVAGTAEGNIIGTVPDPFVDAMGADGDPLNDFRLDPGAGVGLLVGGADLAPDVTVDRDGVPRTAADGYTIGAYELDPPSGGASVTIEFNDPDNPTIVFDGGWAGTTIDPISNPTVVFDAPTDVTIDGTPTPIESYTWIVNGEIQPAGDLAISNGGRTGTLNTGMLPGGVHEVTLMVSVGPQLYSARITLTVAIN